MQGSGAELVLLGGLGRASRRTLPPSPGLSHAAMTAGLAGHFRTVTRVPGSFGMKKTFSPERAGFKPGMLVR